MVPCNILHVARQQCLLYLGKNKMQCGSLIYARLFLLPGAIQLRFFATHMWMWILHTTTALSSKSWCIPAQTCQASKVTTVGISQLG